MRRLPLIVRSPWRHGAIRAALGALALAAGAWTALSAGPPVTAQETAQTQFALDLQISDGRPCETIDELAVIDIGETVEVAVCVINTPEPVAAVTYTLFYDDRVILAPNVGKCDGRFGEEEGDVPAPEESLDCNPDANAGATTFGGADLGDGWDCSSEGLVEPWGHRDTLTGEAFNGACISYAGPYRLPPTGAVGVVTFQGVAAGRAPVVPAIVSLAGSETLTELGSCLPASTPPPMHCRGGVISVRPAEGGSEGSDNGDRRWIALVAVGAAVVAGIAGLGVVALRRRRAGPAAP